MPVLQRNRRREFGDDVVLSIQDYVIRRTAGMVSGGLRTDLRKNLSEAELSELVSMTREAEKPDRRFVLDRLSRKKQARWETLVGKGGGCPSFFADQRAMAEVQALAAQAHKTAVRRPFTRKEQETLFEALGDAVAGGSMSATTLGTFIVIVLSFERGQGFAARSRVERDADGEAILVVSRAFGLLTERQDWRASLSAWRQGCEQLARNSWIEVDSSTGNEMRIKLGTRAKRALRGTPSKARAA